MRCPNCGARIRKGSSGCVKCNTDLKQISNASNKKVSQVRKEYQPELVVYSTVFPDDLSWKSTLLWCIFLGWMGAHCYYVKRYAKAIVMTVMFSIFLFCAMIMFMVYQVGSVGFLNPIADILMYSDVYAIPSTIGIIAVIMWIFDIAKLATKTFKVPVVLSEK